MATKPIAGKKFKKKFKGGMKKKCGAARERTLRESKEATALRRKIERIDARLSERVDDLTQQHVGAAFNLADGLYDLAYSPSVTTQSLASEIRKSRKTAAKLQGEVFRLVKLTQEIEENAQAYCVAMMRAKKGGK